MQKKSSNGARRGRNNRGGTGGGGKPRPAAHGTVPGNYTGGNVGGSSGGHGRNGGRQSKRSGVANTNIEPGDPSTYYEVTGALEMHPNGYGFLRDPNNDYTRIITDPFVPGSMIEKYGFREGVLLTGMVQPGTKTQGPRLREVKVDNSFLLPVL